MKTKNVPAHYSTEDEAGFSAIVSVFNNKDMVGDIVRPGAFAKSIAAWKAAGDPLPVLWSHRMDDPNYNIGFVEDMAEVGEGDPRIPESANDWVKQNGGLWVKAVLDDFGLGAQVRHLLKTRRVKQFSFAYDVMQGGETKTRDGNELTDLWLHEVSATPLGCNPLTELVGAKSDPPTPGPGLPVPDEPPTPEPHRLSAADYRQRSAIWAFVANHTD